MSNDKKVTGTYSIACSIRPYKDAAEQKTLTLKFHLDGVPIEDIITPALRSKRISWQNGPGRSKFNTWKSGQVVDVDFTSPAKAVESDEEKIKKLQDAFMKAGLPEKQALELATKSVKNPEVLE